jgi:DNA-binding transcriptional regulator YiaG
MRVESKPGDEQMAELYHYTGAGLDNVFLENGFRKRRYGGEEVVAIEDVEGLHRAIARSLVEKPGALSGPEFRFLRIELDLSQKSLGELLGVSDQAVANWEKGVTKKPMGAADRLLRALTHERLVNRAGWISRLLAKYAAMGEAGTETMRFLETSRGWQRAA